MFAYIIHALLSLTRPHSLSSLRRRLKAVAAKLRDSPPIPLYHYTSAAGLKGIIESGQLWASNARYLNDSAEVLLGIRHVRSILKSHRRKQTTTNRKVLLDHLWHWMPRLESVSDRAYAVCFCKTDDLLGQWRGYANMGGGYSIGFDPTQFDLASERKLAPRLLRVIYDSGAQRAAIREVLDEAYRWLVEHQRCSCKLMRDGLIGVGGRVEHAWEAIRGAVE